MSDTPQTHDWWQASDQRWYPPPRPEATTRTYHALLIANSTFPDDPHNLPDLEGPRNDPALLRDALCDDRYGLFPSDNIRLVTEREMPEILKEAHSFLRNAHRDDELLLYYSGHGRLGPSNELYLCARNSRTDLLLSTAVKASDLRAMIDDSAAAITVVILDCCHSGAFKGGGFAESMAGRGRYVLTSCRTTELANDSSASNQASLFTHHLVQGMLGRAADHDGDGLIVLDDLYRYAHDRLMAEGRQIPEKSFAGSGDVPMARRPRPSAERALDVSPTEIVLKDIELGEDLPPERVTVTGRDGGEAAWVGDCRSEWVGLEHDQHGLLVHIRPPRLGTNRANLYIRDGHTGRIWTVRLVVHVVAPAAPSVPLRDDPEVGAHPTDSGVANVLRTTVPKPPSGGPPSDRLDSRWRLRQSLWLLSTLPMGLTTWAGFLYVGLRAKRRLWVWTGAVYGVAIVAIGVLMFSAPKDVEGKIDNASWQANVGAVLTLALWIAGIAHGLLANADWLKWRASSDQMA